MGFWDESGMTVLRTSAAGHTGPQESACRTFFASHPTGIVHDGKLVSRLPFPL